MIQKKTFALKYNVGKRVYLRCYSCSSKLKGDEKICPGCNMEIEHEPSLNFAKKEPKKTSEASNEPKTVLKFEQAEFLEVALEQVDQQDPEKEQIDKLKTKKKELAKKEVSSVSGRIKTPSPASGKINKSLPEKSRSAEQELAAVGEAISSNSNKRNSFRLFMIVSVSLVGVLFIMLIPRLFEQQPYYQTSEALPNEENNEHVLEAENENLENIENYNGYPIKYETYPSYYVHGNYEDYYEYPSYGNYIDYYSLIYQASNFMAQFGDTISVYFENFETGFVFHHNPYEVYFASNLAALPFGFYIWQKSSAGYNSILDTVTFGEHDRWNSGPGIIRNLYEVGAELTQRRLLQTMIQHSDNIAILMLSRHHGLESYAAFIENIGANVNLIGTITNSHIDAFNAGFFARQIYSFLEAGYYYSNYFREDLLSNNHSFVNFRNTAANKTAWSQSAMHEISIVYAESPFSLSILSSRTGNAADRQVFAEIADFFETLNENFYGG
ncbi:MAG: class A beta-lactamase-related serine hydrolase [Defluviitaleaceae bacterium]|nr:class A beta-lactamase-related serine hydrolase [Defluviitaleaceae bacterium]